MADSPVGDAAYLGGEEIVNASRTLAYLEAGYGPPSLQVNGGCSCPAIRELAGCDDLPYTIPSGTVPAPTGNIPLDAAPWYDPSVPESQDFAGFLPTSFEGLGSTHSRTTFPKTSGGSVIGKQIPRERIMTWRGFLFGRTCCATQYGLRWLIAQLSGLGCCGTEDLDLLVCCPEPITGVVPLDAQCRGLPSVQLSGECNPDAATPAFTAFRTLKEVALLEGPTVLSERKTGCRGGCNGKSDCPGESCITEIEFSLVAGNPLLYGCPLKVCDELKWEINPGTCPPDAVKSFGVGGPAVFVKANADGECPTLQCNPAPCGLDPDCPLPLVPTVPSFIEGCGACDALDPVTTCCYVDKGQFGAFFDGVPVIEIFSGRKAMKNTKVKFYNNPTERDCEDIEDPCNECDSILIRYIPPESTLVIDGLTKQVILKCPGNEAGTPAGSLTVSPFSWSVLQCVDVCICFETDALFLDFENAHASVTVVPSQM